MKILNTATLIRIEDCKAGHVVRFQDKTLLVSIFNLSGAHAVDLETGKELWFDGDELVTPVVLDCKCPDAELEPGRTYWSDRCLWMMTDTGNFINLDSGEFCKELAPPYFPMNLEGHVS